MRTLLASSATVLGALFVFSPEKQVSCFTSHISKSNINYHHHNINDAAIHGRGSTQILSSPLMMMRQGTKNNHINFNPLSLISSHSSSSSSSRHVNARRSTELSSSSINDENIDYKNLEPKVFPKRWVQLAYLSLLALLSDWICFSVAASPSTFEAAYPGHSAAGLIDMFLFTNVASCFLVTDIVRTQGLQKAIQGASVLMTAGCLLRSGLPSFNLDFLTNIMGSTAPAVTDAVSSAPSLVPFSFMAAGTILVGAAQPFFQCTPPMLSATWFASDERATSTAVALNFNQIGIATAFLVGGSMGTNVDGLATYFQLITVFCALVTAGTLLQFENKPPIPPSSSELEKLIKGEEEPPFIESVKKFFNTPGFTLPLAAFIMSISITNIVGTFIDEVMERGGITDQFSIDLAGAGFEFGILLGGIVIGGYVDKTKQYKPVTMACILATIFLLFPLGLTDHALGKEPVLLVLALLGLGMSAGPIQPINAELAVDVTYPSDETAVESVQQIGGNLFSALLVPLAEIATRQDYEVFATRKYLDSDIRGDVILLAAIASVTFAYFSGFDAPLRRTAADNEGSGGGDDGVIDVKLASSIEMINGGDSETELEESTVSRKGSGVLNIFK
eukprot:CAMPEP_0184865682 /NCGR_PEP_ID=MMETSP0580-20130426/18793_1 /TAXON_ID=1118495 /ORGANISM="Dactyliosolen fragilissimus" /LENGTH=618 /DNA_ID=CAMNT_0027364975 /DNA_START=160 /DNA_END=2016 /DNA_ORIENTATION=+